MKNIDVVSMIIFHETTLSHMIIFYNIVE